MLFRASKNCDELQGNRLAVFTTVRNMPTSLDPEMAIRPETVAESKFRGSRSVPTHGRTPGMRVSSDPVLVSVSSNSPVDSRTH